jgi:PIN domain nuclease of toxin-antitoxin system
MRLLLDTHVWLWAAIEPERLPDRTRASRSKFDFSGIEAIFEAILEALTKR